MTGIERYLLSAYLVHVSEIDLSPGAVMGRILLLTRRRDLFVLRLL